MEFMNIKIDFCIVFVGHFGAFAKALRNSRVKCIILSLLENAFDVNKLEDYYVVTTKKAAKNCPLLFLVDRGRFSCTVLEICLVLSRLVHISHF